MPDSIMTGAFAAQPQPSPQAFLGAAQMRDLWSAFEAARDGYREDDEKGTGAIYDSAKQRILDARTIDPQGLAIKLKVIAECNCPQALSQTIHDLSLPPRGPSLVEFARTLAATALPHVEEGGEITSRADIVDALAPLIGHYTIADAVCTIGFLRTAGTVLSEDGCDDALFAVTSLLEDFACLADAADADSAAARAHLIKMAAEDDNWDLGPDNMTAATRHAASDIRKMRKGTFEEGAFGTTFTSNVRYPSVWLLRAIENTEGGEASNQHAASVHTARRKAELADA